MKKKPYGHTKEIINLKDQSPWSKAIVKEWYVPSSLPPFVYWVEQTSWALVTAIEKLAATLSTTHETMKTVYFEEQTLIHENTV